MKGLEGKKIVITRPAERAKDSVEMVKSYGAVPIVTPTIELKDSKPEEVIKLCNMINELDWLIFTSPRAIKSFFKHCSLEGARNLKIATIGPKTEEVLNQYNVKADLIPDNYTAEGLLEAFEKFDVKGMKMGLPRTMVARYTLPDGLEDIGAQVFLADAYKSEMPDDKSKIYELIDDILNKDIDVVMFTSPLTVKNLIKIAKEEDKAEILDIFRNNEVLVAAIGPITKKVLDAYKINPIMPEVYTFKNMLDKLVDVMNDKPSEGN
ncbi:uroporphyrinogen-III synthase [Methanobacterium sp.]|jgi:uroporphyrinogen-III synthase|uniref:uroporphyrinogen-III synthase n=1 Tax=Methanobacterium sp. TaxID=2164 RepID=UPI00315817C4